jgi:RNA polymerase sigma-70 factor (ECF subfamily)
METDLSPDLTTPTSEDGPSPRGDAELIRRLQNAEAAAGEELVARYCSGLIRYLQRLVGSDHWAEELHQQTWTSVLEHIHRFDPSSGGGFKAWLYRIATNKANDYWRSRGRERVATESLGRMADQVAEDASYRMDHLEQHEKVRRAIEMLPENQKQVVLLRYYGNLKFVEIAEMLGCPLNTALGRMHKAMLRLKKLME